jgi:AraC-like DNA-binding protein
MIPSAIPNSFRTHSPRGPLSRYVNHYWVSLSNDSPVYTALPDGCVDLVVEVTRNDHGAWIYGSTTRPTEIGCTPGAHYLGIRFQPGQSRHFIDAAACEITDARAELPGLMQFPAEMIAARIADDTLFIQLDDILAVMLSHSPPAVELIDHVIQYVEAQHGAVSIEGLAHHFGKSRRQIERTFLQTVGVPLKFFCTTTRLRHAARLIARSSARPLTAIASDAGYSDQAHMTRDFRRLAGATPGQLRHERRQHDAFFQYHSPSSGHAGAL